MGELPDVDFPVETLEDVSRLYGTPDKESPFEHAPKPDTEYSYKQGISFDGRLDDGRVSCVVISRMKKRTLKPEDSKILSLCLPNTDLVIGPDDKKTDNRKCDDKDLSN